MSRLMFSVPVPVWCSPLEPPLVAMLKCCADSSVQAGTRRTQQDVKIRGTKEGSLGRRDEGQQGFLVVSANASEGGRTE